MSNIAINVLKRMGKGLSWFIGIWFVLWLISAFISIPGITRDNKAIHDADPQNVELPMNVPIYPGAVAESASRAFNSYKFSTTDDLVDVIEYYEQYFRNANSSYHILRQDRVPDNSIITSDVIYEIRITNPGDSDHSYIGTVSAYEQGDKNIFSVKFPYDI